MPPNRRFFRHPCPSQTLNRSHLPRSGLVQPFINPEKIPPKLILGQKRGIGKGEKNLVFDLTITLE
jgi:hypothetical protein